MRIAIDGSSLSPTRVEPGGIATWTEGLLGALRDSEDTELVLIAFKDVDLERYRQKFDIVEVPSTVRGFRLLRILGIQPALERYVGPIDVSLGTAFVPWRADGAIEVPVIYDVSFLGQNRTTSRLNGAYLRLMVKRVARVAPLVVTISKSMSDIISLELSIQESNIVVVPPGAPEPVLSAQPPAREHFLFIGGDHPRKNLTRVLSAYAQLELGVPPPPLKVIGAVHHPKPLPGVEFLGYVDDAIKWSLYERSIALVYPSIDEGFGLPILEAMSAGCPVITSRHGATAEVGGDAARLVDPHDVSQIALAMRDAMESRSNDDLVQEGLKRSGSFSWASSASTLLKALRNVST